jgi:hypothetical protein
LHAIKFYTDKKSVEYIKYNSMKTLTFFGCLLLFVVSVNAQQVVASAGNSASIPGYRIDWTIGEPVIETFTGSTHILTQGLHQSKLTITALNEFPMPGLEVVVFPNPVDHLLQIKLENPGNIQLYCKLTDLSGRLHIQRAMLNNPEELDLKLLAPGVYMLSILPDDDSWMKTYKIVKD